MKLKMIQLPKETKLTRGQAFRCLTWTHVKTEHARKLASRLVANGYQAFSHDNLVATNASEQTTNAMLREIGKGR